MEKSQQQPQPQVQPTRFPDGIETRTTDEELAKYLVELYFREIARYSFKRSLSLDDTINAYNFVRKRIAEHKMIRASDIEQAIKAQQR